MNFYKGSNEANLYLTTDSPTRIIKIYKPHVVGRKRKAEFEFLKEHQNSGCVPELYSDELWLFHNNAIVMEYFHEYITLDTVKKLTIFKDPLFKRSLAEELVKSRKIIGKDRLYTDLHKKNVLISVVNNLPSIKFIDPGESQLYYDAWKEWCIEMARELSIVKIMKSVME
jgi:hypothetical protein